MSLSPPRARSAIRRVGLLATSLSLLAGPLTSLASADTGSFVDPRDADAPVVDITGYTISLDGGTVTGSVTLAQWDLAVAQSALLMMNLDTTGDGSADYSLHKGSGGQDAQVRRNQLGDMLCEASTSFNSGTRSISIAAPASCLGDPSFARVNVFFSADEGGDFAPTMDRYTQPVARTGAQPPAPRTPATIACPSGGGTFSDPVDTDDATADITTNRLSYDGSTVCAVVTFRAFDLAGAQAGMLMASLDTTGDGAADFTLFKGSQGESAYTRKGQLGDQVCPAAASFDTAARTITLSAAASCIGSPASVRLNLFYSSDDGDFAPGVDRYSSAVSPATQTPAPTASPTPTAQASSSPSPQTTQPVSSPTPQATAEPTTPAEQTPTVSLSPSVISAGQVVTVTYQGTPNTTLRVSSKTQPAAQYSQITTVTLDSSGIATTTHRPQRNTRLMASTASGIDSLQPLVQVRSVASLSAQRTSGRTYRFTGKVYPAREGRLVSLYRSGVLAGQARTNASGVYTITRQLPAGAATYYVKTGDDTYNLGTNSPSVVVRS